MTTVYWGTTVDWKDVPFCEADDVTTERYRLCDGDVVIARTGATTGVSAYISDPPNAVFASYLVRLRMGARVAPRFVAYFLKSPAFWDYVRGVLGDKSAQPNASARTLTQAKLRLPPRAEQESIARVLGALDDKIELNRRMNETLEAMARALFKSWFVDFDPVRAKMEGRQPAGMDSDTAALFPDSFEESAIGEIPRGWTVRPLDEIADFLNGLALQKYPPVGDDYLPVIKIAEMRRGITESSGRASTEIDLKYVVEDGDILFSWSGSLDAMIWTGGRGALNQHLFKVTSDRYPRWFVLHWIREHLPAFQAIAAGKATTMGHIQRHYLSQALIVEPCRCVLNRSDRAMGALLERMVANEVESRTLAEVRDVLLPRLLSGTARPGQVP